MSRRIAFLIAIVAPVILAGCSAEPDAPIPALWDNEDGSSIELDSDGVANLYRVPVGSENQCGVDEASRYSGTATWVAGDRGGYLIETPEGFVPVWADTEGFGGHLNWSKLRVGTCGKGSHGEFVANYQLNM